ncbi:MAG: DUF1854 domain-containing protein [Oscillospiraceae bacterium]|jgi:hypothetical protein|nr:DUF1854 domain-containing protein [Oscillospiraceae bacterium]
MEHRYIDSTEARITENDGIFVDVEFYGSNEVLFELEPRRLFPVSGLDKYITLLDSEGVEQAIVRDISRLLPESREVLAHSLAEYYMIPRIVRFVKMSENFKIWMWTVDTDRGRYTFEVRNHAVSVKPLYDGRVLIKDANDNRYEIPDVYAMDKRSQRMILPNL